MARSIGFDYDQALDRATWLFWKEGYVGTSTRDLLKVMGIGEGSFYNTLKSKKNLYLECLARYQQTEGRKRGVALMSAPTASLGIRALFSAMFDCLDDPQTPSRLCMHAAMVSEEVLSDPELRVHVEHGMKNIQERLAERLREDRDAGVLPAGLDPETIASVIVTYAQGIWRMALVQYERHCFERQTNAFLSGLGL